MSYKGFLSVVMPSKDTEILQFNQYQKSDKISSIIYADLESLIKNWMDAKIFLKSHLQQK